ncbi:Di-copper centre-containing protein [Venturia nashicola]|uniref:tyrosinase n=1 Tax=Venturia nashicola TaxID=86259 RepID=A0A4Z1PBN2_9PEZI|nr:Di-copper centre-containing protein [Venturia nashicola]
MLFSSSLWATVLLVTTSVASTSPQRRQTAPVAVTGFAGESIQPRLEIRELQQQQPDQWNVYILALIRMQQVDQSDVLSWFSIAGIHGIPASDWDGVTGVSNPGGPGYCTHASNLFLSWHRPYLILYEQVVSKHAMDAASEFTGNDHDRYVTAAQNLRVPYWDWARPVASGEHVVPDSISSPTIVVNTPQQSGVAIQNPLYSYRFHPVDSRLGSPYVNYATTIRHPTTQDSSAQSQEDDMVSAVDAQQDGLRQRVYNLLSNQNNYTTVACEGPSCQGGTAGFDSFESIHDVIHVVTGGNGGHMTNIGVSAFDPIFMAHHTMIDRLSALFQTLNPDSYVMDAPQARSNWWYNRNDIKGAGDALKPFYADTNGNFHTSDSIRDHTKFGYTYSELTSGNRDDVVASINQLYGGSTAPETKRKRSLIGNITGNITSTLGSDAGSLLPSREYVTNVQADKYGSFGSYFIHVFLGEPSSDSSSWKTDPNLVGTLAIFSTSAGEQSGQASVPVTGTMPLTDALKKHNLGGKLTSLAQAVIVPYLTANLVWKAQKTDGCEIPHTELPDLKVSVASTVIQPANSIFEFPKWIGDWTIHTDVTNGKPNGICDVRDLLSSLI